MMQIARPLLVSLALVAVGCGSRGTSSTEAPVAVAPGSAPAVAAGSVKELDVPAVAALVSTHAAAVFDVNGPETRAQYGVVPGARLLSSSSRFDVATELPADKAATLVFYCANSECGASQSAAERAAIAGYSDVNVMRAGIAGWKEAGHQTEAAPRS